MTGTANTATTAIPRTGPGWRGWAALTAHEARMVRRDTAGLLFPLGMPLLILVMSGGGESDAVPGMAGMSQQMAFLLPMAITMVVAMIGVINVPSFLATYRRYKMLRRLSVTPASPMMVLVAQMVVGLVQALAGIALLLVVAALMFDVAPPAGPLTLVGVFALMTTAMFALGMLVAAVSPTPNAALAIGLIGFFAIMALGGGFGNAESLPSWLSTAGGYLPFGAGLQSMLAAWTGQAVDAGQLAALVVTTVVAGAVSARLFKWE
ncbi:ABC transporter [Saccharomonospora sp. CUA-673]|uniref:ABC transporter permease n=1 Tax=Saccharomonospora sp. CUA-673 TaxID=1904969 RepID=UPI000964D15B|nr:ABC transporter permease [Saccharomonospora sp. CUA-673]OLT48245.1 ABC transporter [Saccharomonospora sp. CUA-673]